MTDQTPTPPPPAPEKKSRGCLKYGLIGLVLAVIVGVGCSALLGGAADKATKDADQQAADKLDDAKITDCAVDSAGFMAATVEITNNSSERSNYDVSVAYTSKDGSEQFGTGDAFASALEPGQKISEPAQSLTTPQGEFVCKIVDVTRFSDEP